MIECFGEIVFRRNFPADDLEILHADPRVLMSREFLDEVVRAVESGSREVSYANNVLTIKAANRRLIYRIGEYLPDHRAYVAEWPD